MTTVLLAILLPILSCTDKGEPPTSPGPGPGPGPAPTAMRPVIPDSVQSIFTANCAVPFCHVGATASGREILDADSSYARTVNVSVVQEPLFVRILPGNPADSYLVMKILDDPRISGAQMPRGAPPLALPDQQTIIDWVAAGALPDSIPADSSRLAPRPPLPGN